MKTKAPWGSIKAMLSSLKPGDSFVEHEWRKRGPIYCTARRIGVGISIHQIGGWRTAGKNGFIATITK